MAHTAQDEKSIIQRQQQDIALLNQKLANLYGEEGKRAGAIRQARAAMDESVSMAKKLVDVPVTDGDKVGRKRRAEATALVAYFNECRRLFDEVLDGYERELAERPKNESSGSDAGEGDEQGSSSKESAGDSGKAADSVDSSGSPKE